jgi:NAD(P)-dependent dehydrogenase (short-subunit alcohol dehydrogenase family)
VTDSRPLAVVTGASSGIGRELARQFATNGFHVAVAAENTSSVASRTPGQARAATRARMTKPEGE